MNRIVINPPGRISLPKLGQLWEAREVLYRFGARDITLRYRQTALGVVWVVLQPLLTAGVFTLVFGRVAKLPSGGVPYFIFSFAGLLAWNIFSGIVTRSSNSLVSNASLVSKVYFPRILVPLASAYSVLVDFLVSLALLVALLVAYGINPGWAVVLSPIWVVMVVLLSSGCGLISSSLMVRCAGQVPVVLRRQPAVVDLAGVPVVLPPPAGATQLADRAVDRVADLGLPRRHVHLRADGTRLCRRDLSDSHHRSGPTETVDRTGPRSGGHLFVTGLDTAPPGAESADRELNGRVRFRPDQVAGIGFAGYPFGY